MTEIGERYQKVAGAFTDTARAVPGGAWDNPAPCEGWVARDVVRHLVEWVPPFLQNGAGVKWPDVPSVDDDPVAAWQTTNNAIQAILDDPDQSARKFHNQHTGTHRLDEAIAMFILGDVLVHTWDLARAAGLDENERLDADEVHRMVVGIEPMGDVLEKSGQYGARVPVADDVDEQTRLLALTGRRV